MQVMPRLSAADTIWSSVDVRRRLPYFEVSVQSPVVLRSAYGCEPNSMAATLGFLCIV